MDRTKLRRLEDIVLRGRVIANATDRAEEQRIIQSRLRSVSDEALYMIGLVLCTLEGKMQQFDWDAPVASLAGMTISQEQAENLYPLVEGVVEGKISEENLTDRFLELTKER